MAVEKPAPWMRRFAIFTAQHIASWPKIAQLTPGLCLSWVSLANSDCVLIRVSPFFSSLLNVFSLTSKATVSPDMTMHTAKECWDPLIN